MTELRDRVEIRPAHKFSTGKGQWEWGWVAVDRRDGLAIGVVTTYRAPGWANGGVHYAVVKIVHARRYPGLGVLLLTFAREELASRSFELYRSGLATEVGERACLEAELPLSPMMRLSMERATAGGPEPKRELDPSEAEIMSRRHLEEAAKMLGIPPIPPKD